MQYKLLLCNFLWFVYISFLKKIKKVLNEKKKAIFWKYPKIWQEQVFNNLDFRKGPSIKYVGSNQPNVRPLLALSPGDVTKTMDVGCWSDPSSPSTAYVFYGCLLTLQRMEKSQVLLFRTTRNVWLDLTFMTPSIVWNQWSRTPVEWWAMCDMNYIH